MKMVDKIMNAENVSIYSLLVNGNLTVDQAELTYKNFGANPTKANPAGGKRTFCLMLSEDIAERLWQNGWNVKVKEICDQYDENVQTMTVNWEDYNAAYRGQFDHALIYTEIIVNENGTPPAAIFKASEYDGEKTVAPIPVDRWGDLDKDMLDDITVTIHPWQHGRNALKPEAKKGYLNSLIAKVQPATGGIGLGSTYADYRIVGV